MNHGTASSVPHTEICRPLAPTSYSPPTTLPAPYARCPISRGDPSASSLSHALIAHVSLLHLVLLYLPRNIVSVFTLAMHPFASYVLRSYYKATGWNEDNLYANLTRSSNGEHICVIEMSLLMARSAILDFTVPRGLHFSISKSPSPLFKNTYSMNALPSLNGSVGYIFTSCHLDVKGSGDVRFKDMVDHFKVHDLPRRPEGKDEEWLAGERVDTRGECVPRLAHP